MADIPNIFEGEECLTATDLNENFQTLCNAISAIETTLGGDVVLYEAPADAITTGGGTVVGCITLAGPCTGTNDVATFGQVQACKADVLAVVSTLETRVETNETDIADLQAKCENLEGRIEDLETMIADHETRLVAGGL